MTETTTTASASKRRPLFVLAAIGAAAVATVFATVGDGVTGAEATGIRHAIVEYGHTAVWALLTIAFAIAAVQRRFGRAANIIAVAAGAVYAVFLFSVFLWP